MIYNPFPKVDLPFGEDNKWFAYLFESIIRVDTSFIEYEMVGKNEWGDPKILGIQTHLERVFAYELYRQWMNYLEERGVRSLVVNGEIGKALKEDFEKDTKDEENKGRDNYPDLVLHKSQGNEDQQIMVCEIKREKVNNSDLLYDLYKLSCYTNEKIFWKKEFDYGVFIIVGKEARLNNLKIVPGTNIMFKGRQISIEEYKSDNELASNFSNILCVSYDGTNINYETLDKLIENITSED